MGAEKNVENHIKNDLKKITWYAKFFANSFTVKGVPDILSIIDGKFTVFEVKRPNGGKPTPIQIKNLTQIAKHGGISLITNDPHIVPKIKQYIDDPQSISLKKNHIFTYQASSLEQVSVNTATKIWRHPNDQSTPKEPYSVLVTYKEE